MDWLRLHCGEETEDLILTLELTSLELTCALIDVAEYVSCQVTFLHHLNGQAGQCTVTQIYPAEDDIQVNCGISGNQDRNVPGSNEYVLTIVAMLMAPRVQSAHIT